MMDDILKDFGTRGGGAASGKLNLWILKSILQWLNL